jgi:hypothetical protein
MNNIENTPRREDEIPATQQSGNRNSTYQGQQSNQNQGQQGQENRQQGQQGQGSSDSNQQQGGNQQTGQQADQSSTYRGQEGQEYDVDASDAVNRQADYSGNSERDIEDSTLDEDRDMESQHDSDQNINPGDKAPNSDFNR